jgi:methyl-accepting chemotaxis protein
MMPLLAGFVRLFLFRIQVKRSYRRSFMQWYYDLKTIQKILILVGLMSLFLICISATGVYFNAKADKSLQIIYEYNLKPIRWINLARVNLNAGRTILYQAISEIGQDARSVKKSVDGIKVRDEEMNKNLELVEEKMKELNDDFLTNKIAEQKNILAKYTESRQEVIGFILKGDKNNAVKSARKYGYLFSRAVENISEIASYIQNRDDLINNQGKNDFKFAMKASIIAVLAALIISLVFGITISLTIQNLINKVVYKMNEIAKGNLAIEPFNDSSKSDLGQICSAFDKMMDNLKNLVNQIIFSVE